MHETLPVVLVSGVLLICCTGCSPARPSPVATATPTPAPASTPTPYVYNCPPIRWVDGVSYGRVEFAHFMDQLNLVEDRVFAAHPEIFAKDSTGVPDPNHLTDPSVPTEKLYYAYFREQGRMIPGLCVDYATNAAGFPDPNDSEEIWLGYAGRPLDAFRLTATTPAAPILHKYIATNYLQGYGL